MDMQYSDKSQASPILRIALTALGALVVLAIATSRFFSPIPYYPLIVGGGIPLVVALGMLLIFWYRKPVWALYPALFVALMPLGLIPADVHSMLNRTMAVTAFCMWLFAFLRQKFQVIWPIPSWLMTGFLLWSGVTLLWAGNLEAGTTILQAYILRFIIFLFLIPNLVRTRKELDGLMNTLALSGWLLVMVGLGTIILQGYEPGNRLKVLGMNENEVGIHLIVSMVGVLWPMVQPLKQHNSLKKVMVWVFLFLTIGLIGMSGSRGSAISLFVALLAFCFWKPTRPWGKLGLLILAIGMLILPFLYTTTLERFSDRTGDTLLGGREIVWQEGWELIKEHPLRGIGIGNSPLVIKSYLSDWEQDWVALHNPILAIWSETGIPGIVLYLGVLISAAGIFLHKYKMIKRQDGVAFASYFPLIASLFLGYFLSWIKGGGAESEITYFLMLALLLIPSQQQTCIPRAKPDPFITRAKFT